jgi:hypothetical protein
MSDPESVMSPLCREDGTKIQVDVHCVDDGMIPSTPTRTL